MTKRILALAVALVVLVVPVQASGPMLLPFNTCTEINCGARVVGGSVLAFGPFPYPWTAEFFATRNECLRFDTTFVSQLAGLFEMVVVSPDGRVFRDFQGGGPTCPLCPLVTIPRTRSSGWYTVWMGATGGGIFAPGVEARFEITASRYPRDNPNCEGASSQLTGTPEQEAERIGKDRQPRE
jgi:hypothetical protein